MLWGGAAADRVLSGASSHGNGITLYTSLISQLYIKKLWLIKAKLIKKALR
jgi:hypothetical protein